MHYAFLLCAAHYGDDYGASCYYNTACLADPARVDQW
jgi:hypothetical protein